MSAKVYANTFVNKNTAELHSYRVRSIFVIESYVEYRTAGLGGIHSFPLSDSPQLPGFSYDDKLFYEGFLRMILPFGRDSSLRIVY